MTECLKTTAFQTESMIVYKSLLRVTGHCHPCSVQPCAASMLGPCRCGSRAVSLTFRVLPLADLEDTQDAPSGAADNRLWHVSSWGNKGDVGATRDCRNPR